MSEGKLKKGKTTFIECKSCSKIFKKIASANRCSSVKQESNRKTRDYIIRL